MVVRITAHGTAAPVSDAFVTIREAGGSSELSTVPCRPEAGASVCRIPGGPGAYDLVAGAPGYDGATARARVADTTAGACCPTVATQEVKVDLAVAR